MSVIFEIIRSVTMIPNRSSTSQTCHQHAWSPTSMSAQRCGWKNSHIFSSKSLWLIESIMACQNNDWNIMFSQGTKLRLNMTRVSYQYSFRELSQRNLFYYKKMDSSNMGFDDDISLTDYIKENIKRPFFFHQHHFYTNFTK